MNGDWARLFGTAHVTVDGGLSTQLVAQGLDTSGPLWTGRAVLDDPGAVTRAHAAFVRAGADVIITSSYQLSRTGFAGAGLDPSAADMALRASTRAARDAIAGGSARVAASVGPYGAVLHDGSEYRGRYGLTRSQLADFHRERLDVLASTEPDLLAVETIPDIDEAEALVDVLADHPHLPAWMTFSAADDAHTCAGQRIEDAVAAATAAPSVMAVGVNCTDPRHIATLVARMRSVTPLPIVVYPNAGGEWDAATGQWLTVDSNAPRGLTADGTAAFPEAVVRGWLDAGAAAVGGCCGTDARAIRAIARVLAGSAG